MQVLVLGVQDSQNKARITKAPFLEQMLAGTKQGSEMYTATATSCFPDIVVAVVNGQSRSIPG